MNTIDRFITGAFLSSYLILLAAGTGLYIFSDLLFNWDEFTENPNLSTVQVIMNMVNYYGYNLPLYYHQLGGAMMAVAAAFTFGTMLRNNELTALVAAGVPLPRLAFPVMFSSVLLVGLWVANSELVVPALAHKIARHHDDLSDTREVEVHCVRDDSNAILSAAELYANRGWMRGVYIIEPDEERNPSYLIRADGAAYDRAADTWHLDRGARLLMGEAFTDDELGATIRWEPLDEYAFGLTPEQILLRQSAQWSDLMSIRQMNELLKSDNLPNLPAIAKSRHIRFMQPLMIWTLLLLTIPFFLTCAPANVLVAGGKSMLLGGACFAFTFISHSITTEADNALLAAALPLLVFGPVAVLNIANVRT